MVSIAAESVVLMADDRLPGLPVPKPPALFDSDFAIVVFQSGELRPGAVTSGTFRLYWNELLWQVLNITASVGSITINTFDTDPAPGEADRVVYTRPANPTLLSSTGHAVESFEVPMVEI